MGLVAIEGRSLREAEATSSDERNENGLAAAVAAADSAGGIEEGLQEEMGNACGCCRRRSSGTLPVVRDARR